MKQKHIFVTDFTLRDFNGSFKDATEIAKLLDSSGVSTIVTMPIKKQEKDSLLLRTLSQVVEKATLCVPIEADKLTEENIALAIYAVESAQKHAICLEIPTSDVQMEFLAHAKPKALMAKLASAIDFAKTQTAVYVSMLDSTRTDFDFIKELVDLCIKHGVAGINFSDDASYLTPSECAQCVVNLRKNCIVPDNMALFSNSSDILSLGLANSFIALDNGMDGICTSFYEQKAPTLFVFANLLKTVKKFDSNLKLTEITQISIKIGKILEQYKENPTKKSSSPFVIESNLRDSTQQFTPLGESTTIKELQEATEKLGYTLSDDSIVNVYEAFYPLAKKKPVTASELEAIIATSSMRVKAIYALSNFVVTCGDNIATTATVHVKFEGQLLTGLATGAGPIDAVFKALEQAIGLHYELDDFQIAAVTEGKEALGRTIVKLRSKGRIYAGLGLSANIIESSISAYLSALNKIHSEG
ncbi:MAG: alpha-isopropylmalate synthase regulatory domain-containing protein [Synergistaceae bacterium]|nr:alpha-isopropylmalate synthase regulatory domain-containing protein [Synergistaceae bacterium]